MKSIVAIVACGSFFSSWSHSHADMIRVPSPQVSSNELYITSTTDFAHAAAYQFAISKEKTLHLPKWSPDQELPFSAHAAAGIATAWYRSKYPEARTAQIQSLSIQSIQETDQSHWYYCFFLICANESERLALSNAIPIAIVLFDGSVVEPRAIGAGMDSMPTPPADSMKATERGQERGQERGKGVSPIINKSAPLDR